jgi:hypothetical protein
MAHYRCYFLDGSGKIMKSEDIEAASDADAVIIARQRLAQQCSHAFELWQGRDRLSKESRGIDLPPSITAQWAAASSANSRSRTRR